jgi:hypothetical protein
LIRHKHVLGIFCEFALTHLLFENRLIVEFLSVETAVFVAVLTWSNCPFFPVPPQLPVLHFTLYCRDGFVLICPLQFVI